MKEEILKKASELIKGVRKGELVIPRKTGKKLNLRENQRYLTLEELDILKKAKAIKNEMYAQKKYLKLGAKRDARRDLPPEFTYDEAYYKKFNTWVKKMIKERLLHDIEEAKKNNRTVLMWGS